MSLLDTHFRHYPWKMCAVYPMVFLCIVFEIFRGFTKCSAEIYFISYVCWSCFIVGEDDSGRRGSVRGGQCHHHALRYTIMTMNTRGMQGIVGQAWASFRKFITSLTLIIEPNVSEPSVSRSSGNWQWHTHAHLEDWRKMTVEEEEV